MRVDLLRPFLLAAGAVIGYAVLMACNPARPSLRDGLRCLARYKQIWLLPAAFAVAHSGFRLWRRVYESWVIPGAPSAFVPWAGWQPPPWKEIVEVSWLPAAESTSAIFNCIVTTFPLSALAACLFLVNWRGYHASLFRALRRRFGWFGSLAIQACLFLSAAAAACKPILFGGLPSLNGYFGAAILLRVGEIVDSVSFVFEYLLGVGVQIYVILLCFAWIRGLTFDFDAMRRFALRRFAFVVKWASVVIVFSTAGIGVPLIVSSIQSVADPVALGRATDVIHATRWLLSFTLLLFCSMQVLLIFHNETLGRALGDHFRLLWRHGGHITWLVLIVAVHFFALAVANAFLPLALGFWTWPSAAWSLLIEPVLWTALAGWFLASWVCLFRRCERNRPDLEELVRF